MHWGHAVSKDLDHWKELGEALYPDEHGMVYSESAVGDWRNTAGFQTGKEPALVAMFTAAGRPFTQGTAYSNDRGRTLTKYENNPVLGHIAAENRDPKVAWFAPEQKWVMALFLGGHDFAIFDPRGLKHWAKTDDFRLAGDAECPNFFEVPLDGDKHNMRWVFFGATGYYVAGRFDGRKFTPETQPRRIQNGNCWYAAQVYSDIPEKDGRCILVPWGRLPNGEIFRGMTFNQMMGLPVELKLASSASGPMLKVHPVRELESLRGRSHRIKPQRIIAGVNPLAGIGGDLFEIEAVIAVGSAKEISFNVRGVQVKYDASTRQLSCLGSHSELLPRDGKISLRMFVDRRPVDIYEAGGGLYMPMASAMPPSNRSLNLSCTGGDSRIRSFTVHELKPAW